MRTSLTLVVGLGKTGLSIARYLQRQGNAFCVFDTRANPESLDAFRQSFPDVSVDLVDFPKARLHEITSILCSPGVSLEHPLFVAARELNIPVMGDIECFARSVNAPVIAITGTNGKSTVTTLVGEMAKTAGLSVAVAGNIGTPVLDQLADGQSYDLWVLELSSFQLELTHSLKPVAATVLNVTPDHLDRHHTLYAYWQAKQRVYLQADVCFYNRLDEQTKPDNAFASTEKIRSYGLDRPQHTDDWGIINNPHGAPYLAKGQQLLFPFADLKISGRHNWMNAMAACALASAMSIPETAMITVLQRFNGLPHRCQWVRELEDVVWINDSKGTNIGATISAIEGIAGTIRGKIVLIAGGQGKGADFNELKPAVTAHVRAIALMGQDAPQIEAALREAVPIERVSSLEKAVLAARSFAQPGDVVLLSPACASLDMFRDYNHRGEVFTTTVAELS